MHKKTKRTESQYIWGVHRGVFWAVYFFLRWGGGGLYASKQSSVAASGAVSCKTGGSTPCTVYFFPKGIFRSFGWNAIWDPVSAASHLCGSKQGGCCDEAPDVRRRRVPGRFLVASEIPGRDNGLCLEGFWKFWSLSKRMINLNFLIPILHPKLWMGCMKKRLLGFITFSILKLVEYTKIFI